MLETETQRVLKEANQTETLTDAEGQEIEVRRLSRRELMRCMRMWGPPCNVESWLGMAIIAASVRTLGGKPLPLPASPEAVEAVAEMMGPAATKAVEDWFQAQATEMGLDSLRTDAKN